MKNIKLFTLNGVSEGWYSKPEITKTIKGNENKKKIYYILILNFYMNNKWIQINAAAHSYLA